MRGFAIANERHEPDPPMRLLNMYEQDVRHLRAFCHNDAAFIDVSSHPDDTPVPWFRTKVKSGKCGGAGVGSTFGPTGKRPQ